MQPGYLIAHAVIRGFLYVWDYRDLVRFSCKPILILIIKSGFVFIFYLKLRELTKDFYLLSLFRLMFTRTDFDKELS